MKAHKHIEALNIKADTIFNGSEAEIEEAEAKEAEAIEHFKSIIESPDFLAMRIQPRSKGDVERIIHHSTYPGFIYQMSISYKDEPLSHRNYGRENGMQSIKQMYIDLVSLIYLESGIDIEIITA